MKPPTPLFRPQTPPVPLFWDEIAGFNKRRPLEVFEWENRLVAHEAASTLWWGTLDTIEEREPRDFWRDCVQRERVGRALSVHRNFPPLRKNNGAKFVLEVRDFDLLIAHDNSGLARMQGETQWHTFRGEQPTQIYRPLAHRPSVWSPRFHTYLARRGLEDLHDAFAQEQANHLLEPSRLYWEQGTSAPSLRLVVAARKLGWVRNLSTWIALPDFWLATLRHRASASPVLTTLPATMQQSPELDPKGTLYLYLSNGSFARQHQAGIFQHKSSPRLWVELHMPPCSAHEELEARLELRDWLSQFFPTREVESWFD